MRSDDEALSAGDDSPASQGALLDDASGAGDASPASQAALEDGSAGGATKPPPRCASPRPPHAAPLEDVALDDETPAADQDAEADGGSCCCGASRYTNHAVVLTVALELFLSITCAQFGLALLARSSTRLVGARRCSSRRHVRGEPLGRLPRDERSRGRRAGAS